MDREKRTSDNSIPANLEMILNEVQLQALPGIKYLGWEPWFLRRPMFQAPEFVMHNTSDGRTAVLDVDGRIRISNIKLRKHEPLKAAESGSTAAGHDKELALLRADNEKLLAELKEVQFANSRLTEQIEQQRGELCESAEKLSSLYAQVQSDTVEMKLLQQQYAALQEQYADTLEAHKLEIEQPYIQPSLRATSHC